MFEIIAIAIHENSSITFGQILVLEVSGRFCKLIIDRKES